MTLVDPILKKQTTEEKLSHISYTKLRIKLEKCLYHVAYCYTVSCH